MLILFFTGWGDNVYKWGEGSNVSIEVWKPVVNNPRYLVSDKGNVKSVTAGVFLKPWKNEKGYLLVRLECGFNKRKNVKIHRAVALSFLGVPVGEKNKVNHKDGVKTNNHLDNLEWVTTAENVQHSHDTGLVKFHVPVVVIDIRTNEKIEFKTISKCGEFFGLKHKALKAVIRRHEVEPWNGVYLFKRGEIKKPRGGKAIYGVDLKTAKMFVAVSFSEMERTVNISYNAIYKALTAKRLCNGHYFWLAADTDEAIKAFAAYTESQIDASIARHKTGLQNNLDGV